MWNRINGKILSIIASGLMHALVIISVRPWLEMQGLSLGLRVSKLGKLQDKGKLGKLGKFHVQVHVCSGNVHTSDCGSAHCNGCVVNGIFARTAC